MTLKDDKPFFELRRYNVNEGKLDQWVDFMDSTLIPFQRSCGMVIVGSWAVPETNQYVWIRRFENEADREKLYKAAYENDYWLKEARPLVGKMIDREDGINVTRMVATPFSIIR